MKNYHTVAFDLDGTLTDPKRGLTSAFAYGLRKVGVKFDNVESLKKFIGPPLRDSFRDEYGLSEECADDALMLFREYFGVYGWWDNELYPGIHELLSSLKAAGKTLVLATSKPEVYSSKILKLFGLSDYFDFAEGASFDSSREKKCDVLDYALSKVGIVTPEEKQGVVLVGDTRFDIEGAVICGVDSIGVTYGYGNEDELLREGATYIAKDVKEIGEILLGFASQTSD
ncbi:MAG: HAD hydrolase-like protein [Clostridia bacterium]|nr:HAD hydrolase-like protein [Clostridia bacterium]